MTASQMVAWPATLPGPQLDDISVSRQDNLIRSAMDIGPGKVRRRFTAVQQYYKLNWLLDSDQLAEFEYFFGSVLAGGALSFAWPSPFRTKALPGLLDPQGDGTVPAYTDRHLFRRARFRGPYERKRLSQDRFLEEVVSSAIRIISLWQVTAELEVWPGAITPVAADAELEPTETTIITLGGVPLETGDLEEGDVLIYTDQTWTNHPQEVLTDAGNF